MAMFGLDYNYTPLATCFATGANFAVSLEQRGIDLLSVRAMAEKGDGEHLGPGTNFWQRRAFEWGYLSIVCGPDDKDCAAAIKRLEAARERERIEREGT